jgi:cation diffusion facilitator CzcD-associated flavoprotein CzcO
MTNETQPVRVLVLGAGMSGILSAIKLEEAGIEYAIYEKADRLGGTWRENTYAGIACDVPSHFYSYSFSLNPEWTRRFSPGAEIQSYFERVAHEYGIDSKIQYGKEVTRCAFEDGRWKIEMSDGSRDEGDFVVAATGVLHHPAYPDIEGLHDFEGTCFHSARWDAEASLEGKRVGVIGTGSSAIQIVAAVIDQVKELSLFQRTPQWIMPIDNPLYSEEEKVEFRRNPEAMLTIREQIARAFTDGFANVLMDADSPTIRAIHDACEANLENSVKDPELREKLRPTYRAACKRLIMSEDFYDAIQRPHAKLVTERIARAEPSGLRTVDGELHELDVLILATGFRVDRFVRPMRVFGRDGIALDDVWKDGPFAYLALTVPGFPNFFMLNGPNGPVGNFSLIEVAELQFAYVLQLIERIRAGRSRELSASREAMDRFHRERQEAAQTTRFHRERQEAAQTTIWNTGCKSWYLDANGLPTAWPWTFDRFREEMSEPKLEDYEIH